MQQFYFYELLKLVSNSSGANLKLTKTDDEIENYHPFLTRIVVKNEINMNISGRNEYILLSCRIYKYKVFFCSS